jgi:predicted O-methyltransferase YrrM
MDKFPQGSEVRACYEEMLARGRVPVVLDCGANIGFSTYWQEVEFPQALVIAVEPDVENAKLAV